MHRYIAAAVIAFSLAGVASPALASESSPRQVAALDYTYYCVRPLPQVPNLPEVCVPDPRP
jgi:hypothetical protein